MATTDKDAGEEIEVEPTETAEPAPEAAAEDPVARLEAEVAALKDQLLRALAEAENQRRRSQRERDEAIRYAAAPLVKDLINVADNLRRALDSVPAGAVEGDEQLKTLMTGVEMTEKELKTIFEKHHIVPIDPLGERLDPHAHEAMFEVPEADAPPGTVVQVLRIGYRMHDRLLRPAQVSIAKGSAKPGDSGPSGAVETGPGDGAEPDAGPRGAGGNGAAPGSRIDTTA